MDRNEYAFLALVALATIAIGVVTTSEPFGKFFVNSTVSASQTMITMAWITWLALVVGVATAGSVEAETPCVSVTSVGDVQRMLPIPKPPAVADGSRSMVSETVLTGGIS